MNNFFRLLLIGLLTFASMPGFARTSPASAEREKNSRSFFTRNDMSNWAYVLKDKKLDPASVFKMDKGVLHINGESGGYLRTKRCYKNFTMSLQWRWTESLGNSGVLVHIQPKDTVWPVCYQVQLKAGAAGDLICMNGLRAKECTDSVSSTVVKMKASNEKPLGEWNTMMVVCKNNTLKVYVNGVLQNRISGLSVCSGFVGLQNEGKPMEFRDLKITTNASVKK